MDAEHLEFAATIRSTRCWRLYVAPVVPSPAQFAAEMKRVCIPGGTIVLVNHVHERELGGAVLREARWRILARHIGFHPDFEFDKLQADDSKLSMSARSVRANPCSAIGASSAAST